MKSGVDCIPRWHLTVDGAEVPSELHLSNIRVRQSLGQPSQCELTYVVTPATARFAPSLGQRVSLNLGIPPRFLFEGDLTAVEWSAGPSGQRELRIRAYDDLHRLRLRQTLGAHVDVSIGDLARALGRGAGLRVADFGSQLKWDRVVNDFPTDLAFLNYYARRAGRYAFLDRQSLKFLDLEGQDETIELKYGGSLIEGRMEQNAQPCCGTVRVLSWDPITSRRFVAKASCREVTGDDIRVLTNQVAASESHAESIAHASAAERAAAAKSMWGVARGDTLLSPGRRIRVLGLAPKPESFVISSVTHLIDGRHGYLSEFNTEPPLPADLTEQVRQTSVTAGQVSDIDDPKKLGRAQVTMTTFGEVPSSWMPVVQPGAGSRKGLVVMPEVGDQVLVLLVNGDPARGVILGGLFGIEGPPQDTNAKSQAGTCRPFSLRTPGGQYFRFNDADESIRIENSDGSFLSMDPKKVVLHSATDLVIEAPGRCLTISANTIDFERAT